MSDCEDVRPRIAALLDRELSTEDAAHVQEHVRTCEACNQVFAEYSALQNAAALDCSPQTVDLWARIGHEISPDPERTMVEEMRLMRLEMKALRDEVSALRRELAQRPNPQFPRSTVLSAPDSPKHSYNQYRLV